MTISQPDKIGPWRILRPLNKGGGGNSKVWLAESAMNPSGQIALKVPLDHEGPRFERFKNEVEILRTLGIIPGVIPLLDASVDPADPWLAMPVAEPLSIYLTRETDLRSVVNALAQVSATLAELALAKIHHRDIKPDNLYVHNGRAAIGDFGLVAFEAQHHVTEPGQKLGTSYYAAPEMLTHPDKSDPSLADVYSLGKTLWVLATGQTYPIPGEHRVSSRETTISAFVAYDNTSYLDHVMEAATTNLPARRCTLAELASQLAAWLVIPGLKPPVSDIRAALRHVRMLTEAERQEQANRVDRQRMLTAWADELFAKLETTEAQLWDLGQPQRHIDSHGRESGVRNQMSQYGSIREGRSIEVETSSFGTGLNIGIVVQLFDDETVVYTGVHAVAWRNHEGSWNRTWWACTRPVRRGTPEQALALDALLRASSEALPDSIFYFTGEVEKRLKVTAKGIASNS